jgi:hypothetical protein
MSAATVRTEENDIYASIAPSHDNSERDVNSRDARSKPKRKKQKTVLTILDSDDLVSKTRSGRTTRPPLRYIPVATESQEEKGFVDCRVLVNEVADNPDESGEDESQSEGDEGDEGDEEDDEDQEELSDFLDDDTEQEMEEDDEYEPSEQSGSPLNDAMSDSDSEMDAASDDSNDSKSENVIDYFKHAPAISSHDLLPTDEAALQLADMYDARSYIKPGPSRADSETAIE